MSKQGLLTLWRKFLIFVFFYSIYHLIRDIFQDIFNIRNDFTQILHFESNFEKLPSFLKWTYFGGFRKWITFPVEIYFLLIIPKINKKKFFTVQDKLIFAMLLLCAVIWLSAVFYP